MSLLILQPKKVLTNQIQLIKHTTGFFDEKVNYITLQQGIKSVCKRSESCKTAALNVKVKVDEKLETRRSNNYLSLDDSVFSSIVNEGSVELKLLVFLEFLEPLLHLVVKKLPHRTNLMV